ncbi:hypothetical protein QEN19_002099 [Hanseniaspora menglaensis]
MKFSEHLKGTRIPEWEDKYVNYKAGKKIIAKYVKLKSINEEIDFKKEFIDNWVLQNEYKKCENFYKEKLKVLMGSQNFEQETVLNENSAYDKNHFVENFFIKQHNSSVGSILLQIKIYITMMKEREDILNGHELSQRNLYGSINETNSNVIFSDIQHFNNGTQISQNNISYKNKILLWLDKYEILPSIPSLENFSYFQDKSFKQTPANQPLLTNLNLQGISNINFLDDQDLDGNEETNVMSIQTEWIWNWQKLNKLLSDSTYELIALLQKLELYRNTNIQAIIKIIKKFDKRLGQSESLNFKKFLIKDSKMCNDLLIEKFDDVHSSLLEENKPTEQPSFTSKLHEAISILSYHYTTTLSTSKEDSKKRKIFLKQSNNIMNNQLSEFMVKKFNITFKELFIAGVQIGISIAIIVKTLLYGLAIDTVDSVQHKILLPIWGGFYLIALMALLYQLNCYIWFYYKINYKFIMFGEIKPLKLDQFGVLTNFYNDFSNTDISRNLLLMSLILLLCCLLSLGSLSQNGMLEPYCSIFLFFVIPLVFLKPEWIYSFLDQKKNSAILETSNRHSTMWFLTPFIRLFGAFWYPVEFTDFFLGDILCSLGYSFTNLFLIYCYDYCATKDDYSQCSSSKSYTMGILSAIPSWLRALQCLRRFLDSGDWFPHVPNGFKYCVGVCYNIGLMFYRLNPSDNNIKRGFIGVAIVNSLVTSCWDIVMDFSLLQSWERNTFGLRKTLLLCTRKNWETNTYESWKEKSFYYFAIFEDFVLRFNWIVYFIFPKNIQQNAMTSIFMAFMELFRRFIWIIIRIENLQVINVTLYNISIDHMKLPYQIGFHKVLAANPGENEFDGASNISNALFDYESLIDIQEQMSLMEDVNRYYSNNPSLMQKSQSVLKDNNSIQSSIIVPKRFRRASSALNMIHKSIPYAHSQDFQKPKSKRSPDKKELFAPFTENKK